MEHFFDLAILLRRLILAVEQFDHSAQLASVDSRAILAPDYSGDLAVAIVFLWFKWAGSLRPG